MLSPAVRIYNTVKFFIPRRFQIALRRKVVARQARRCSDVWPISPGAGTMPEQWEGWPSGKKFALVLTHDVDTQRGHDRCSDLAAIEEELGFRSAFNFVAGEYAVSTDLRKTLAAGGFEVGVHGWVHNSSLYRSRDEFLNQASKINSTLRDWNAVGFRSPCMYHNLEWLHDLEIEYDASTFDTDPFEPQPHGMNTIFPMYIADHATGRAYVELPYTLPQDFTLFVLMQHRTIDVWKEKLRWIAEKGGMALVNVHPDYMHFGKKGISYTQYAARVYQNFLEHVSVAYSDQYWHSLPRDIARFWADRARRQGTGDMR